jgi:hypothetical protein
VEGVVREVHEFADGRELEDDLTLIVVKVTDGN